jgi:hypothetical protein
MERSFKDIGVSLNFLGLKTWDELMAETRKEIEGLKAASEAMRPDVQEKKRQSAFLDYLDRRAGI